MRKGNKILAHYVMKRTERLEATVRSSGNFTVGAPGFTVVKLALTV